MLKEPKETTAPHWLLTELAELREGLRDTVGNDYARVVEDIERRLSATDKCDVCGNIQGRHYVDCILVVPRPEKATGPQPCPIPQVEDERTESGDSARRLGHR